MQKINKKPKNFTKKELDKKRPEGYFYFGKFIPGKRPIKPNGKGSR